MIISTRDMGESEEKYFILNICKMTGNANNYQHQNKTNLHIFSLMSLYNALSK